MLAHGTEPTQQTELTQNARSGGLPATLGESAADGLEKPWHSCRRMRPRESVDRPTSGAKKHVALAILVEPVGVKRSAVEVDGVPERGPGEVQKHDNSVDVHPEISLRRRKFAAINRFRDDPFELTADHAVLVGDTGQDLEKHVWTNPPPGSTAQCVLPKFGDVDDVAADEAEDDRRQLIGIDDLTEISKRAHGVGAGYSDPAKRHDLALVPRPMQDDAFEVAWAAASDGQLHGGRAEVSWPTTM